MPILRIRYLAAVLNALKLACKFLPLAASTVRPRIKTADLATYDAGVAAVQSFCSFLEMYDFVDDGAGTE